MFCCLQYLNCVPSGVGLQHALDMHAYSHRCAHVAIHYLRCANSSGRCCNVVALQKESVCVVLEFKVHLLSPLNNALLCSAECPNLWTVLMHDAQMHRTLQALLPRAMTTDLHEDLLDEIRSLHCIASHSFSCCSGDFAHLLAQSCPTNGQLELLGSTCVQS